MSGEPHVTRATATDAVAHELAGNRRTMAQWFGVTGGPLAMLGSLPAQYALVPWACYGGVGLVLHVAPALSLALAVAAAAAARREWRAGGGGEPGSESGVVARARFLGALGVGMSLFFAIVIAAMWLADAFLNTCHGS